MKPIYPIFVISKGRFENPMTHKKLSAMGVNHYVVVEPQESADYKRALSEFGQVLETPFSNLGQGSIPVRNYVWELAENMGVKRYWIMDDNLSNFYLLKNGKRVITKDADIIYQCEKFVDKFSNVPMAGMNYTTFAIPHKNIKPFTMNTRIYSCILLETAAHERWRGRYNEDTDLSLRFLKNGDCTILFNAFLCDKTVTMTMKGGNEDIYKETNNRREFAESLYKQHPDVVKIKKRWDRWHHVVDYKPFKNNQLRRVK